jgi:predicted GH43/DUF377 family glycosyl hydrolase
MIMVSRDPNPLGRFTSHHRLATPVSPWERLKIRANTSPMMTRHRWLILYHGVSEKPQPNTSDHHLCSSAGVIVLSREHPQNIPYRSTEPVLKPELPAECQGTVAHVVFPKGIDRRDDLGTPERFDVYYGIADNRIGAARLNVPAELAPEGSADSLNAKASCDRP